MRVIQCHTFELFTLSPVYTAHPVQTLKAWAGGGWTLCAHAGNTLISGGDKHWYNPKAWGDHPHFNSDKAEGSVCGELESMDYVLWQITDDVCGVRSPTK
jgi:hypothetical protein